MLLLLFPFLSGGQAPSARAQVQTVGGNHNATPSTLGVLYPLLVVEGQGAHPRAAGVREQVWVCSADAGVLPRLEGKVSKDIASS